MLPIWSLVAIFAILISGYVAAFEGAILWVLWQFCLVPLTSAPSMSFWQWFMIAFIPNLLVAIVRVNDMFKD